MIRSVSHICRQWGFTKLTNQQTNHVVNTENLARIFCQPNLTFYSSASLNSDTVEDSNEGSSEVKLLLDQLEASHPGKLNASKACSMMYALAQSAPKDVFKAYFNDAGSIGSAEKYPLVTTIVKLLEDKQIDKAYTKELNSALKSASILGIPNESFLVQNIENTLTWRCRTSSIKELNHMLSTAGKGRSESITRQKLFDEVIRTLEMRWVEIDDPLIVAGLIYYAGNFTDLFLGRIEDKMTNRAGDLSSEETIALLKALAFKKRRQVPLLKALVYHLTRKKDMEDLKLISDALFAVGSLNMKDPELLETLCINGAKAFEDIKANDPVNAVVRSILSSLGHLSIFHENILDSITNWYTSRLEQGLELDNRDLLAYLMTTANLNHQPNNSEPIYKLILQRITKETVKNSVWLKVVWCLVILQKAESHHFESILNGTNAAPFLETPDLMNGPDIQKLLNINAAAKFSQKDYTGPTLGELNQDLPIMKKMAPSSGSRISLNKNVFDAFHSIASPPNFLWQDINSMMGFNVDAEAVFEVSTAKPLGPIQEMGLLGRQTLAAENLKPLKELPEGSKRVAVLVLDFTDCLLCHQTQLSGLTALKVRLLQARGYNVLVLRYNDITGLKKLQQIRTLSAKLQNLLQG